MVVHVVEGVVPRGDHPDHAQGPGFSAGARARNGQEARASQREQATFSHVMFCLNHREPDPNTASCLKHKITQGQQQHAGANTLGNPSWSIALLLPPPVVVGCARACTCHETKMRFLFSSAAKLSWTNYARTHARRETKKC